MGLKRVSGRVMMLEEEVKGGELDGSKGLSLLAPVSSTNVDGYMYVHA